MLVALGGSPETSGGLPHSIPHGGLGHQPARVDQIRRLGRRTKQERELDAVEDHPVHAPRPEGLDRRLRGGRGRPSDDPVPRALRCRQI